jgi:hypothetical protein
MSNSYKNLILLQTLRQQYILRIHHADNISCTERCTPALVDGLRDTSVAFNLLPVHVTADMLFLTDADGIAVAAVAAADDSIDVVDVMFDCCCNMKAVPSLLEKWCSRHALSDSTCYELHRMFRGDAILHVHCSPTDHGGDGTPPDRIHPADAPRRPCKRSWANPCPSESRTCPIQYP